MRAGQAIRFGIMVVYAGFLMSSPVYAQSTGWLNANELPKFTKAHFSKKTLPTSISCKDSDVVAGMDRRNTMVKIEYGPNSTGTKWKWAWGTAVGKVDHDYKADGFKIVSEDSFRRPSGLLIRCAIWHKQP